MKRLVGALLAATLAGCSGGEGTNAAQSGNGAAGNAAAGNSAGASAATSMQQPLRSPDGVERGMVTLTQADGGLQVRVEATGLPPGAHGAHVHAVGSCNPPDFASAGPHWNPSNRQHGAENPAGPHLGDIPNLMVGPDGRGTVEFTVQGANLAGAQPAVMDADGGAFVVHANADDNRTDPSGNSGDRIACAAFR